MSLQEDATGGCSLRFRILPVITDTAAQRRHMGDQSGAVFANLNIVAHNTVGWPGIGGKIMLLLSRLVTDHHLIN